MSRSGWGRDPELSARLLTTGALLAPLYFGWAAFAGWLVVSAELGSGMTVALGVVPAVLAVCAGLPLAGSLRRLGARFVSREDEPELHAAVERLCLLADLSAPRLAVLDSDVPNAFTSGFTRRGSTVVVTRGLLDRLTPPELEAVLAHELAHLANRDAAVMTAATYPLFLVRWATEQVRNKRLYILLLLPPVWGLVLWGLVPYWVSTRVAESLSRARELAADRGGVLLTGSPEHLMSALAKLAGVLRGFPEADLRHPPALNAFFIVPVGLESSTHPPLEERLDQLSRLGRELSSSRAASAPPRRRSRLLLGVTTFLGGSCVLLALAVAAQELGV